RIHLSYRYGNLSRSRDFFDLPSGSCDQLADPYALRVAAEMTADQSIEGGRVVSGQSQALDPGSQQGAKLLWVQGGTTALPAVRSGESLGSSSGPGEAFCVVRQLRQYRAS